MSFFVPLNSPSTTLSIRSLGGLCLISCTSTNGYVVIMCSVDCVFYYMTIWYDVYGWLSKCCPLNSAPLPQFQWSLLHNLHVSIIPLNHQRRPFRTCVVAVSAVTAATVHFHRWLEYPLLGWSASWLAGWLAGQLAGFSGYVGFLRLRVGWPAFMFKCWQVALRGSRLKFMLAWS